MSITRSEVYFEMDDDNVNNKALEPQVSVLLCQVKAAVLFMCLVLYFFFIVNTYFNKFWINLTDSLFQHKVIVIFQHVFNNTPQKLSLSFMNR